VGDRLEKVPLYAEAGIQEMWLVNLVEDVIEVYSAPVNGHYTATRIARRGESLSLPGGLPGAINIDSILT
jgi:Uma2 family endonuclease